MRRREFQVLAGLLASIALGKPTRAAGATITFGSQWNDFKSRFLTSDGRIVDTGNGGISHTEGQGYGMVFAHHANDQAVFDQIWQWTQNHLAMAGSALHAWKFVPDAAVTVPSLISATDAELMIALALARAGASWKEDRYTEAAAAIFRDIRLLLTVQVSGRNILLPGQEGFTFLDRIVANPSYYLFPAIAMASQMDNATQWNRIADDGRDLLSACRFGPWALPADWVSVSRNDWRVTPAPGHSPRFSYDAVRVPLYLRWGNCLESVSGRLFQTYWQHFYPNIPSWIDLDTGERSPSDGPSGFQAIARMTGLTGAVLPAADSLPRFFAYDDYYSSSLCLLSWMICDELHDTASTEGAL